MTGAEARRILSDLGLSAPKFGALLRVDERTAQRWMSREEIPGPVSVLLTALSESAAVRRYFGVDGERPRKTKETAI